jgi:hypothetical protein
MSSLQGNAHDNINVVHSDLYYLLLLDAQYLLLLDAQK